MVLFQHDRDRQLADHLMQPALIRVIDNLRKRLEASSWRGEYQERLLWPDGISEAQKQQVISLRQQLAQAEAAQTDAIQAELKALPQPFPGYELHLRPAEDSSNYPPQIIDVWALCCQACFLDYDPSQPVTVDQSLVEADGEIDWLRLDEKVQQLVNAVFPEGTGTIEEH